MDKKEQPQNIKKPKQQDIKIKSLDIDKAEYQEIVLSHSNAQGRWKQERDY